MKKNAIIYIAYISEDNKKITVFSKSENNLKKYLSEILKENPFTNQKISVRTEEFTVQQRLNKELHFALINFDDSVFVNKDVSSLENLLTWIKIKGGNYKSTNEWDKFLESNELLEEWVSGKIKLEIFHSYEERSKDFGYRIKYGKDTVELKSEKIWEFENFFNGTNESHYGHFAKYSYTKTMKISKVITENKTYEMNQNWIEEISKKRITIG